MRAPRLLVVGGTAVAVVAAAICIWLHAAASTGNASAAVAQFTDQGVTVTLAIKDRSGSHATLEATFAPQHTGFHLYSIDLPATGVGGVGRPIRVTTQGALRVVGPLTANTKVLMITLTGTSLVLPVYPDGPVTTDLPVELDGSGSATVLVSYAACSSTTCLPPVTDHAVTLKVNYLGVSG